MVEEDTRAFIETITTDQRDRRAEKLERLALSAEVEYRQTALRARVERNLRAIELGRDPGETTPHLDIVELQADLERMRSRSERLRKEAKERRDRSAKVVGHRLHSGSHYIDCSVERYEAWLRRQATTPVLVTTKDGRRWWWFLGRFWWDDERLGTGELKARVLRLMSHRTRRDEAERARSALLDVERSVLPESLLDDIGWTPRDD